MTIEELIKYTIKELKEKRITDRVVNYLDYGSKYAILNDYVKIHIGLKDGVEAYIDITDLVKGE